MFQCQLAAGLIEAVRLFLLMEILMHVLVVAETKLEPSIDDSLVVLDGFVSWLGRWMVLFAVWLCLLDGFVCWMA